MPSKMLLDDLVQTSFGVVSLMEKGWDFWNIGFFYLLILSWHNLALFSSSSYFLIHTVTDKWSMSRCLILSQRMLCVLDWRRSLRRDTKASQAGILHVSSFRNFVKLSTRIRDFSVWYQSHFSGTCFILADSICHLYTSLWGWCMLPMYSLLFICRFFMCCPYIFSSAYVWFFLACSFALCLLFSVSPEH